MDFDESSARRFLALPQGEPCPDVEKLMEDLRAILLHTVNLRAQVAEAGIQISPIWEECDGQAALRATVVPTPIELRHFEGKGMATLLAPDALRMIAEVSEMLAEEPAAAAQALQLTAALWLSDDAPVRPLDLPYKGHFKLLTLVLADFLRKVGAGFEPLEWLTSLGLLRSFHDPAEDPPLERVRAATREKVARMVAEEEVWMASLLAPDGVNGES
jgi:hypothetical protein